MTTINQNVYLSLPDKSLDAVGCAESEASFEYGFAGAGQNDDSCGVDDCQAGHESQDYEPAIFEDVKKLPIFYTKCF